jgi:hypothetical protein
MLTPTVTIPMKCIFSVRQLKFLFLATRFSELQNAGNAKKDKNAKESQRVTTPRRLVRAILILAQGQNKNRELGRIRIWDNHGAKFGS